MARKENARLNSAAVRIGTAMGRANRRARNVAGSVQTAREELRQDLLELTKTADRFARDLRKANKRMREAFR
ncbi:MAG TPA: hypothetical protein VNJ12_06185 [Candidatus Dormibacteraeota bacterium]|nr:hypothetical protein [Candidatus Dormibacteraeota bacterium]